MEHPDRQRNLSRKNKFVRHLPQLANIIMDADLQVWLRMAKQTLQLFVPALATSAFRYHVSQDYGILNGTTRLITAGESGHEEYIAFVREFAPIADVKPCFVDRPHEGISALEVYSSVARRLQQDIPYYELQNAYAVGGPTSIDRTCVLNNGLAFRDVSGQLVEYQPRSAGKGGLVYDGTAMNIYLPEEHEHVVASDTTQIAMNTSLAFEYSPTGNTDPLTLWGQALDICDINEYWSTDNDMIGFLIQSEKGFRYLNVHIDKTKLDNYQAELTAYMEQKNVPQESAFKVEQAKTVLLTRVMLEHLAATTDTPVRGVALEENYAIKPRPVDDMQAYLEAGIAYPVEILLIPAAD